MMLAQLEAWFTEWKNSKSDDIHDPVESSDNYYWAGAGSLQDFLRSKVTPSAVPAPLSNSCNRHDDCTAANAAAKAKGVSASHCYDEDCEDCFGC